MLKAQFPTLEQRANRYIPILTGLTYRGTGSDSGPFTIALLDRMRSKTEVNYQKLLGDCAFIRQSKVESVTISTPSQQHYARKISN